MKPGNSDPHAHRAASGRMPRPLMAARRALVLVIVALLGPWPAQTAAAHPLGNFTVNRYVRVQPTGSELRLYYVLDMAEIPTFQETAGLARDARNAIDAEAAESYANAKTQEIARNLRLEVNGVDVPIAVRDRRIGFSEGQAGLPTLRLEALFTAELHGDGFNVTVRDLNEPQRLGWREIVVQPGPGASLRTSTAPAEDVSDELRRYPDDMLSSPLNRREASFSFSVVGGASQPVRLAGAVVPAGAVGDSLAGLITGQELTVGGLLLALVLAMGLGALHALSPGHGKTIVAAYLVGSRGTPLQALLLGITVTATHTIGVYTLGLLTLFASAYILPERVYPWLSLASGLLIVILGAGILRSRIGAAMKRLREPAHGHDHGYGHTHDHGAGSAVGWRGLVALGVSGGLLPCPSALLLMLSAIALQRTGLGLVLTIAFSAGLAATLIAVGLLTVTVGRSLAGLPRRFALPAPIRTFAGFAPALSALVVLLAGLAITVESAVKLS